MQWLQWIEVCVVNKIGVTYYKLVPQMAQR